MSTNVPEHLADWEAQRERLSALLDGQLSAAESAAVRVHVSGCARCTDELEALRRVVGALRALPQPTAPRSFALPLTTALPADAPPPRPIAAARVRPARWVGITQWAGAVAACIGFVILFGTLALGGGYSQQTAASFGATRHMPSNVGITNTTTTQPPAATTTKNAIHDTASATPQTASGSMPSPTTTSTRAPSATPAASPFIREPVNPPDLRATARIAGASLLIGGLAALFLGWRVRRRGLPR
jgi:hypothetical protein